MTSVINYLPAKLTNSTLLYATGLTLLTLPPVTYLVSGLYTSRKRHSKLFSKHIADESTSEGKHVVRNMQKDYDLIIVGAGVIGSALAGVIAEKDPSRRICVIERDLSQPDRIIGELLQPGGLAMLDKLNLQHCSEGIDASVVKGYGVFLKGEQLNMHYPENETGDRPTGRGMHYGRFVTKLRENMKQYPQVHVVQGSVKKLLEKDGVTYGATYKDADTQEIKTVTASLTVVANGAGSGFTKAVSGTKPLSRSTFVGLRLNGGNAVLPYPNHGNVFMMHPGPVIAYPTSSQDVRVLIDFPNGTMPPMPQMATYLRDKIAPQFPDDIIRNAFLDAVNEGDIRSVPNREMPAERSRKPGVLLLGDALTTRHPLTGSGMTAGLTDVYHITNALQGADYEDYESIQRRLDVWWKNRNSSMATINILANALYAVFTPAATPDPYVGLLQDAVFSYFKTGGVCVSGPVGLLGGLIKNPYILASHYFAVAFFTVREACRPLPTPWSFYASYRAIKCAVGIVFPLMAEERILRPLIPTGFFNRDEMRYGTKALNKLSRSS
uniref:Squalene monooxygenase n=1 Tax=Percolomonas cosmopolitus TaxID=63605 RepID=A0A7S1KSW8_9EUKA|eukprot:CAMPEP_0117456318 /NCGR_PEP_ID=MMETSP0759-20121206/11814_1 /TAXON_ID=63605 /ORGANISM="Percolomonas cosmopolitus, Strain WS" /LENGTH=551 /DNA_ID=CAMNT_0005249651 /DNA_START=255 /DNA_END=1910 /DNA_ORIENTATION=+